MIRRDPGQAASRPHDLIVVGGGVYGATLALEAARRGLRPLLLERDDFGEHTSGNSLRIVHGGLRALQRLDLRRFFESVGERRWFLGTFPDLVQPLPCLMPLYGQGLRRRPVLGLALRLNDWLSRPRRRKAADARAGGLPPSRMLAPAETLSLFPGAERRGLRGGALWHDAVMPDSPRVLTEILRWTARCGGAMLNYVVAQELLSRDGGVEGVLARDRETKEEHRFHAPVVVNCAGPWCREVARLFDRDRPALFRPSLAFNLLLDMEAPSSAAVAVAAPRRGARVYFLYPAKGHTLAGTFHAPCQNESQGAAPTEQQVETFLAELREALPGLAPRRRQVIRVLWGFLPVVRSGSVTLEVREVLHDHGAHGGPQGLLSVSGVKFTTARSVAAKSLRVLGKRLGPSLPHPDGATPPPRATLPGPGELRRLLDEAPESARAVVRRIVEEESVVHLTDLLLRRTDWGFDPREARTLAPRVSDLLPWSAERRERELALLEASLPARSEQDWPGVGGEA